MQARVTHTVHMPQEEYLLSSAIALAVSVLLGSLTAGNSQDYVFAGYFLICASSFLKLNWLRGALPPAATSLCCQAQVHGLLLYIVLLLKIWAASAAAAMSTAPYLAQQS